MKKISSWRRGRWLMSYSAWGLGLALLLLATSSANALLPPVRRPGLFGCIDGAGKYVIPPIYTHIDSCGGSVIAVHENGLGGFLDNHGQIVLPVNIKLQENGFLPPLFVNGPEPAGELGHMGYIDVEGTLKIPPKFKNAYRFGQNGHALVFVGDGDGANWQRAIIDTNGRYVIEPHDGWFYELAPNGLAAISENGLNNFGYIDHTGKVRIPEHFEQAEPFADNGLAAVRINGKWGYIDSRGKFVIPPRYDGASNFGGRGAPPKLALVILTGREMFIDRFGHPVVKLRRGIATWGDFAHGLAPAKNFATKTRWGYVDEHGRLAIELQFQAAGTFADNGTAEVEIDGKWGYIDKKGKFVIDPQFDSAMPFSHNGLAAVEKGGKWGYINLASKFVIPPQYNIAHPHEDNGLALVEIGYSSQ
jgi:hypothetical protein